MIKKLNDANAGVKRPLRVSDLQDLWDAIALSHTKDVDAAVLILYGFKDKGDGNLSEGIAVKGGVMYYHPDITGYRIPIDSVVYGHEIDAVDERVFDDATTQDFSFNLVASITVAAGSKSLGTFTLNYIAQNRTPTIYREVTGRLTFAILDKSVPTIDTNFAEDNDEDSDIVVDAYALGTKTLGLTIKDGNGDRMKKNFTAYLEGSANVLSMIASGQTPDFVLAAPTGDASDIIMYYSGDVVDSDFDIAYRVKILFDV